MIKAYKGPSGPVESWPRTAIAALAWLFFLAAAWTVLTFIGGF